MTLIRWDPLRDLLSFQERVSRIIDSAQEECTARRQTIWTPVVDVLETPDAYIFRAELPGVGKENINIEIRGNRLTLTGRRSVESEPAIAAYHTIERIHGVFARSFSLPGRVESDKATARYVDGMLEIVVPKAADDTESTVAVISLP